MRGLFLVQIALFLFGIGLGAGCKSPKSTFDPRADGAARIGEFKSIQEGSVIETRLLQGATNLFTLGPGDTIEIEMFGDTNALSHVTVTVGPDGKIYYYLLPGLDVWGLSLPQTKDKIESEFEQFFQQRPEIGITLRGVESKRIWLLGRVQNPGVYPLTGPITLLEAISQAGGALSSNAAGTVQEPADLHHGFVIRDGEPLPVDFHALLAQGNMSHNIFLQPDDFIYIPSAKARQVYVLGAVVNPQSVAMKTQPTVASVIARAGGLGKDAYASHVAIVRGSLNDPKIAIVNYGDIIEGKVPDVLLAPQDIVYVPLSPYRTLRKYADLILTTFVRAVAINEGARAATDEVSPVGVGINVGANPAGP